MAKETKEKVKKTSNDGGNAVYVFGLFGALIYFVQQADGFGQILLGILKAIAWPAFVVYRLLGFLGL